MCYLKLYIWNIFLGDCSASTMWDNDVWFILPGNSNCSEPRIIHADYIRHLVPDTKIIVLLREPISRLEVTLCTGLRDSFLQSVVFPL